MEIVSKEQFMVVLGHKGPGLQRRLGFLQWIAQHTRVGACEALFLNRAV